MFGSVPFKQVSAGLFGLSERPVPGNGRHRKDSGGGEWLLCRDYRICKFTTTQNEMTANVWLQCRRTNFSSGLNITLGQWTHPSGHVSRANPVWMMKRINLLVCMYLTDQDLICLLLLEWNVLCGKVWFLLCGDSLKIKCHFIEWKSVFLNILLLDHCSITVLSFALLLQLVCVCLLLHLRLVCHTWLFWEGKKRSHAQSPQIMKGHIYLGHIYRVR